MIRLAVIGVNETRYQALATRLRSAALERVPTADCDAFAFLSAPADDLERWLQVGKPVLVAADLPLATLRQIVDGRPMVTVTNPERYLPSRQLIKQHLAAGKLGAPGLVRIHRWQAAPDQSSLMRDLELIHWYFAADVRVAYAVQHARGLQVHLGVGEKGMATIDHATIPGGDPYYSLTVIGAHGAAYADDHANVQLAYQGGQPRGILTEEAVGQYVTLLQEFIDALASGHIDSLDRTNVGAILQVFDAISKSIQMTQAVVVAEAN